MAWAGMPELICDASFMTPAYIRSTDGSQGNGWIWGGRGQNVPKNANDHEQMARVHPAQPSYYVVVPTTELRGDSVNVAVRVDIGVAPAFRKRDAQEDCSSLAA